MDFEALLYENIQVNRFFEKSHLLYRSNKEIFKPLFSYHGHVGSTFHSFFPFFILFYFIFGGAITTIFCVFVEFYT